MYATQRMIMFAFAKRNNKQSKYPGPPLFVLLNLSRRLF